MYAGFPLQIRSERRSNSAASPIELKKKSILMDVHFYRVATLTKNKQHVAKNY